jgi:hypothetical protein
MGVPDDYLALAKSRKTTVCGNPVDRHDIMSDAPTEKAPDSINLGEEKVI